MKVTTLENISEEVLDYIKDNLSVKYRVSDKRASIIFGKRREYFLFSNDSMSRNENVEWCFIWIDNGLWQFSYCNTLCSTEPNWKNPLDLLNELLNEKS